MPENPIKVVEVDKEQFEKVVLLSEKSEKILTEFSEQLKASKFTSLMGLVSKGAPDEIIKALTDFQQCNAYFKRNLITIIANQESV